MKEDKLRELIEEMQKDLGKDLSISEIYLVKMSYYRGHTVGHKSATDFGNSLIKKIK